MASTATRATSRCGRSSAVNDGPEAEEQGDAAERTQDRTEEGGAHPVRAREPAEPERDDASLEEDEPEREEAEEVVIERDHRPPREHRRVGAADQLTKRCVLEYEGDDEAADADQRPDHAAHDAPEPLAARAHTGRPS